MGFGDYIIIGCLLLWAVGAVSFMRKHKKSGKCLGCSGNCGNCGYRKKTAAYRS